MLDQLYLGEQTSSVNQVTLNIGQRTGDTNELITRPELVEWRKNDDS